MDDTIETRAWRCELRRVRSPGTLYPQVLVYVRVADVPPDVVDRLLKFDPARKDLLLMRLAEDERAESFPPSSPSLVAKIANRSDV